MLGKKLDQMFTLEDSVAKLFGYAHDWRIFPWCDRRDVYWFIDGGDKSGAGGTLVYSDDDDVREQHRLWEHEQTGGDRHYTAEVYTYRHFQQWVWRTPTHTLVLADTHCDLNVYLAVLNNDREC